MTARLILLTLFSLSSAAQLLAFEASPPPFLQLETSIGRHAEDECVDDAQAVSMLQSQIQLEPGSQEGTQRRSSKHERMPLTHLELSKEGHDQDRKALTNKALQSNGPKYVGRSTAPVQTHRLAALATFVLVITFVIVMILRKFSPESIAGFFYALLYLAFSACLINFNKYIMQEGVFPHAMVLSTWHMIATWASLATLYRISPGLFPSMEQFDSGPRAFGAAYQHLKYFVPLGLFFAVSLLFANEAYRYCGVAFLQFMKETNLVPIYIISVAVGLQRLTRSRIVVIFSILVGAAMAVAGQIDFVLLGFLIQMVSQISESCKNVLGEWMMNASKFRLDALTYTLSMAPMTLIPLAIGSAVTWSPDVSKHALRHWHLLLLNAANAIVLNVMVSLVLKNCSAMGFVLTGVAKDICIIFIASFLFGDIITTQQTLGFVVTLCGILAWTSIKLRPEWWAWSETSDEATKKGSGAMDAFEATKGASGAAGDLLQQARKDVDLK